MGLFTIQIVLLEDNPVDAQKVIDTLANPPEGFLDYSIKTFNSIQDAQRYVRAGGTDIILMDLNLRDETGLDTFKSGKELAGHTPLIVLSGYITPIIMIAVMQLGGYHCLSKSILNTPEGRDYFHISLIHAYERSRYRYHLYRLQGALTGEFRDIIGSCSNCHRWRDESKQEWLEPEKYMERFSEARFSHGICETCRDLLYSKGKLNG